MNGYYKILTKRTTLTLPTNLSKDEMKQAVANVLGIPLEQMPEVDIYDELAKIRQQSQRVNEIIKDHQALFLRNPKTTKDKYEELHDTGKFILAAGDNFELHVPEKITDFPDFILNGEHMKQIGIEHTRLMSEEMKAAVKTIKHFISKANELIAHKYGHLSKTVNIFVDFNQEVIDQRTFKSKRFTRPQKEQIPKLIAEYILSELTGGTIQKPAFITQTEITENHDSRIDLLLAERYFTQEDFMQQLIQRIQKKEKRTIAYRRATNLENLWLLIVIDDISSFSGFNVETAMVPVIKHSNFDSIYIFEKFNCRIFQIFSKTV